jgi:surface protein
MNFRFSSASAFASDLNEWDVSQVTDMNFTFSSASAFASDLNAWDVSGVKVMSSMF